MSKCKWIEVRRAYLNEILKINVITALKLFVTEWREVMHHGNTTMSLLLTSWIILMMKKNEGQRKHWERWKKCSDAIINYLFEFVFSNTVSKMFIVNLEWSTSVGVTVQSIVEK